jgi:basic membrane lipoprotein Med (substrate-binding protein (PBP1-ABC) superfamily)
MLAAAAENPDIFFVASQWDNPGDLDNFAGYVNAPEDGAYISGVIAGHMIDEGATVGWVDSFPIPYDIRTINGFALGLQHSNPTATVNTVFTNDWADANLFSQAARSLVDLGVPVLAGLGGPSIGEVAESSGTPLLGIQYDASGYAPTVTVTTSEYTWAPMLERYLESIFDGNFDTSFAYQGMDDGVISLTDWGPPYDDISDDAKADIDAEIERISTGSGAVFTGPLVDIDGVTIADDGEVLDVAALRSMAWVMPNVEGVDL